LQSLIETTDLSKLNNRVNFELNIILMFNTFNRELWAQNQNVVYLFYKKSTFLINMFSCQLFIFQSHYNKHLSTLFEELLIMRVLNQQHAHVLQIYYFKVI